MEYILGIDTGGTYTDGALIDMKTKELLAKGKSLTTKEDLVKGIVNCIKTLGSFEYENIKLICLSTTLATNATVEGKGGKTALILVNEKKGTVDKSEYPADIVIEINGKMDIKGREVEELSDTEIIDAVELFRDKVDAVAVSGYASVRNPEHELYIKKKILEMIDIPIVCGHELTSKLGYYERAVTAALNARLIPITVEWMAAVKDAMKEYGINAPMMIVKGDGNLISEALAIEKPIDTILSGPAASIIGGLFLSGLSDCNIVDMGGTTTDIACVHNHSVKVNNEGAMVNNWRTRVRAAEINTFGLGGDSRIFISDEDEISIGPERITPLCAVSELDTEMYAALCGSDVIEHEAVGRTGDKTGDKNGVNKIGMTPTDILHAEGSYTKWDDSLSKKAVDKYSDELEIPADEFIDKIKAKISKIIDENIPEDSTVVAIGAPVSTWMREVNARHDKHIIIPEHAEVANAIGAAVGQINEILPVLIRYDKIMCEYIIFYPDYRDTAGSLEEAKTAAKKRLREMADIRGQKAGSEKYNILEDERDTYFRNELTGENEYVETNIIFSVVGKPKWDNS